MQMVSTHSRSQPSAPLLPSTDLLLLLSATGPTPTTPQMRPTLMDPEPMKPEVQKQFCDPNCPALAERCAECSMDCKSCLQERPTYANGKYPLTFPTVSSTASLH